MTTPKEVFVGIDVAKLRNAVAIADAGRDGEIRYMGEFDASLESMKRLVTRLAGKYPQLHFCYEAGPTGYGLHRLITELGHSCVVVAPSLIPRKPGDRIKTNRRDATGLARLLRAGELTPVWVPDPAHEAMRNLIRSRTAAVETIRAQKQQVGAFLLRHSRIFPRQKQWGARYRRWLQEQSFEQPADQIVLQEYIEAVRLGEERLGRIEKAIAEFLPDWHLAPVVEALQALRGIDLVVAVSFVVEIGDIRRFSSPGQLMGYLGLVPTERSTGETVRRGSITKMGNARIRQLLVESAWTYRFPPRVGVKKQRKLDRVSPKIREIAWKAQSRLSARFRAFVARGKKSTVACTAIARELVGFMWAVAMEVQPASPTTL
ncbi:MAG TPA: IS110 family transposase [Acidobacteriaceae bacterium]|jgi:transposase